MTKKQIRSPKELIETVEELGFLPFFRNDIPNFSIKEICPPELWFSREVEGPWEWKGTVIRSGRCLYGKLFNKKVGFVSKEWIPDLVNYRRDGYDFDARWEDGLALYKDKDMYDVVAREGIILSKKLKEQLNYRKGGNGGFETVITRLQMQTYICVEDFVYMRDKYGIPYGWGVARYATPEMMFGEDFVRSAYGVSPEKSRDNIVRHLEKVLPDATERQILKIIG